jgi:hypothetical protein
MEHSMRFPHVLANTEDSILFPSILEHEDTMTWRLKAAVWPSAERGFAENVPVATQNRPLLDNELLKHVSRQRTEESKRCPELINGIQHNADKHSTGTLEVSDFYAGSPEVVKGEEFSRQSNNPVWKRRRIPPP